MDFDDDYVDSLIASSYHSVGLPKRAPPVAATSSGHPAVIRRQQKRPPLAPLPQNLSSTKASAAHLYDDSSLGSNANGDFYYANTRAINSSITQIKPFNNAEINVKKAKLRDKARADPAKESHIVLINGFADDFRKWCEIRIKYVKQIKNLCQVVSESSGSNDVVIYSGFTVNCDSIRPQFLILVAALRKINCKLVQVFQQTITMLDNSKYNKYDITKHLLRQIELYLYHDVIPSLNWLQRQPYLGWMGVSTAVNNPFLLPVSADGSLTDSNTTSTPKELALTDIDRAAAELFNKVLINIFKFNKGADLAAAASAPIGDSAAAEGSHKIIPTINTSVAAPSREKKELVSFVQKNLAAGLWWMRWRRSYRISSRITTFLRNKQQQFARRVFNELQTYCWKCVRFRSLQLNYFRSLKSLVLHGWKQYCRWVRKFKAVLARSNRKIKRLYLYAMYDFSQLFHECRDYKRKYFFKIKREVFNNFKTIVVLNKFSQKRRLKTKSHLSFQQMFLRKAYFCVWFNNASVLRSYGALDALVLRVFLRSAFSKLRENAFPFVPFEQKMLMIKDAVQQELIKTFKFSKKKFIETALITRTLTQKAVTIGREKGSVLISKMKLKIEEIKQQRVNGESLYSIAIKPRKKVDPSVANQRRRRRIQAALKYSIKDSGNEM